MRSGLASRCQPSTKMVAVTQSVLDDISTPSRRGHRISDRCASRDIGSNVLKQPNNCIIWLPHPLYAGGYVNGEPERRGSNDQHTSQRSATALWGRLAPAAAITTQQCDAYGKGEQTRHKEQV